MDLTRSYEAVVPAATLAKYDWVETRNAAAVLASTNAPAFDEVLGVLHGFWLEAADITEPGKNKSRVPRRLDKTFRDHGWREASYGTRIISTLTIKPYRAAGEKKALKLDSEISNDGYLIDNVKARVALDVEWHAKDGNLDRDLAAYRALYEAAIVDAGIIITRSFASIRALSISLGRAGGFQTTTTTTLEKMLPRLARGDGGGCPVLGIAITDRCYVPVSATTAAPARSSEPSPGGGAP